MTSIIRANLCNQWLKKEIQTHHGLHRLPQMKLNPCKSVSICGAKKEIQTHHGLHRLSQMKSKPCKSVLICGEKKRDSDPPQITQIITDEIKSV